MPPPPPGAGISELVLEVSALEAARRFYGEPPGFEETRYGEGRDDRRWYLIGDRARLGIWTPQVRLAGGAGGADAPLGVPPRRGPPGPPPRPAPGPGGAGRGAAPPVRGRAGSGAPPR